MIAPGSSAEGIEPRRQMLAARVRLQNWAQLPGTVSRSYHHRGRPGGLNHMVKKLFSDLLAAGASATMSASFSGMMTTAK